MEEIWKDVPGYEGRYEVSNFGNVRSMCYNHTGQTNVLKPRKNRTGYLQVNLYKDGQKKTFKVHRLVAKAFVPNPLNLPQINHINECKLNNRADNLEWCDCRYNQNYGTRNDRIAKAQSRPVIQFDKSGDIVKEWPSLMEVERQTGWYSGHISRCCHGKLKTAYNHIWRYSSEMFFNTLETTLF